MTDHELTVQSKGKDLEPFATRRHKKKQKAFLNALSSGMNITAAAKVAGYHRRTVYRWRDEDPEFAAEWEQAIESNLDALEGALYERATEGMTEYVVHDGKILFCWVDEGGNVVEPEPRDKDEPRDEYMTRMAERGLNRKPVVKRKFSDTGAIFLLKGGRKQKYSERTEHTDQHGQAIEVKPVRFEGLELARRLAFLLQHPEKVITNG